MKNFAGYTFNNTYANWDEFAKANIVPESAANYDELTQKRGFLEIGGVKYYVRPDGKGGIQVKVGQSLREMFGRKYEIAKANQAKAVFYLELAKHARSFIKTSPPLYNTYANWDEFAKANIVPESAANYDELTQKRGFLEIGGVKYYVRPDGKGGIQVKVGQSLREMFGRKYETAKANQAKAVFYLKLAKHARSFIKTSSPPYSSRGSTSDFIQQDEPAFRDDEKVDKLIQEFSGQVAKSAALRNHAALGQLSNCYTRVLPTTKMPEVLVQQDKVGTVLRFLDGGGSVAALADFLGGQDNVLEGNAELAGLRAEIESHADSAKKLGDIALIYALSFIYEFPLDSFKLNGSNTERQIFNQEHFRVFLRKYNINTFYATSPQLSTIYRGIDGIRLHGASSPPIPIFNYESRLDFTDPLQNTGQSCLEKAQDIGKKFWEKKKENVHEIRLYLVGSGKSVKELEARDSMPARKAKPSLFIALRNKLENEGRAVKVIDGPSAILGQRFTHNVIKALEWLTEMLCEKSENITDTSGTEYKIALTGHSRGACEAIAANNLFLGLVHANFNVESLPADIRKLMGESTSISTPGGNNKTTLGAKLEAQLSTLQGRNIRNVNIMLVLLDPVSGPQGGLFSRKGFRYIDHIRENVETVNQVTCVIEVTRSAKRYFDMWRFLAKDKVEFLVRGNHGNLIYYPRDGAEVGSVDGFNVTTALTFPGGFEPLDEGLREMETPNGVDPGKNSQRIYAQQYHEWAKHWAGQEASSTKEIESLGPKKVDSSCVIL